MEYYTDINSYQGNDRTAVTLGKFDSLHKGHQKLVAAVQDCAGKEGLKSVVFAFDMKKSGLLTNKERRQKLEGRADCLIQCPFTDYIREMEAEAFIKDILAEKLRAAHIVVGTDFRFGHSKKGDVHMLSDFAKTFHYEVEVIHKAMYGDRAISSTYVREALKDGNLELAAALLGYPYRLTGIVEHGRKLGRRLGFPTMNVSPEKRKLLPRHGVYTCRVRMEDRLCQGISNVGIKPTVTSEKRAIAEVYVFDYEGDAYGKEIAVELCSFVRPEVKFHSVEELKQQVDLDIAKGRQYFQNQVAVR